MFFSTHPLYPKIIGNGRISNPHSKFPILEGAEKVPMCQIFELPTTISLLGQWLLLHDFSTHLLYPKIIGNGRISNSQGKFPILEGAEKVPMCQIFNCQQQ